MLQKSGPRLLIIATPLVVERDSKVYLDTKFVEGARLHCAMWPGRVRFLLRRGEEPMPFAVRYSRGDLGFELALIDRHERIEETHLQGFDMVLCAGDAHDTLHVSGLCGKLGVGIVYSIEYTLKTRLQIAAMDSSRNFPRMMYAMAWNVRQELRRRRAFRLADGIQANGYPAEAAYKAINANTMMYLDNRMKPEMFASADEMRSRADRLHSGAPLRLLHSGRLERMKGSHDLIPIATALRDRGVAFSLDIYGDGSLRDEIRDGIAASKLSQVRLHDPVDFETELVRINRNDADVFLSCHRQSDPSCTYLESMACGLPVAGYDNDMWLALHKDSGAGWVTGTGRVDEMADKIRFLADRRDEIVAHGEAALAFARGRNFPAEFARRMQHLHDAHEKVRRRHVRRDRRAYA